MRITVYNESGVSIPSTLLSYNSAGLLLQQDVIQAGGSDYDRPGEATHWIFSSPGYQDALRNDLLNYENFSEELIPKYRWVVPTILGLTGFWLLRGLLKG